MSEYAGRIAVGVVLVVIISVAFAFELNNYLPANSTSTTIGSKSTGTLNTSTLATGTFGSVTPPCPQKGRQIYNGYQLDYFLTPSNVTLGADVCIFTSLKNLDNASVALPRSENVTVVNNSTSDIVFQGGCTIPAQTLSFAANATIWNCGMTWDTANGYHGVVAAAGLYVVSFNVSISGQPTVPVVRDLLEVGGSQTTTSTSSGGGNNGTISISTHVIVQCGVGSQCTTTTTTSTIAVTGSCSISGEGGQVFVKVMTDEGSIVNNGTIQVTHVGPTVNGVLCGTANYNVPLNPNATGYVQVSKSDGLPSAGSYNLTIIAGYGGTMTYASTITNVVISPLTTTYLTISIPSGEMIVSNCYEENNCSMSTTTITSSGG